MSVSNKFNEIQQIKFDLFKSQNPEIGRFDVIFEIQGKLLYAHKIMLNLISDTFNSMLSDRWISKDEPIKLKDYTFEEFYQFFTFLYSAECEITDTNIFSMVDMAEFYNVPIFKNYCDEFLSKMEFSIENIFVFLELSEKYSLDHLKTTVEKYVTNNFSYFVNSVAFLQLQKSFIEQIIIGYKDKVKPEELFQAVYKWTENWVLSNGTKICDKNDAIKTQIADFLSYINFSKMNLGFLIQFVVPRGFIFTSLDELSKILNAGYFKEVKVTVTNILNDKLYGTLKADEDFIETIKTLKLSNYSPIYCWWKVECKFPYISSPIKKRDEIKWYLYYRADGYIGVKYRDDLTERDYLLAEMIPEEGTKYCSSNRTKIEIE